MDSITGNSVGISIIFRRQLILDGAACPKKLVSLHQNWKRLSKDGVRPPDKPVSLHQNLKRLSKDGVRPPDKPVSFHQNLKRLSEDGVYPHNKLPGIHQIWKSFPKDGQPEVIYILASWSRYLKGRGTCPDANMFQQGLVPRTSSHRLMPTIWWINQKNQII